MNQTSFSNIIINTGYNYSLLKPKMQTHPADDLMTLALNSETLKYCQNTGKLNVTGVLK